MTSLPFGHLRSGLSLRAALRGDLEPPRDGNPRDHRMTDQSAGAIATPETVLTFWRGAGPDKWFTRDDAFDADVRDKFLATYEAAAAGKLAAWEASAEGALALAIVLDQFPRNMFRGEARCYAADPLARQVANRALKCGYDQDVPETERGFFFLPFMHSEDM